MLVLITSMPVIVIKEKAIKNVGTIETSEDSENGKNDEYLGTNLT